MARRLLIFCSIAAIVIWLLIRAWNEKGAPSVQNRSEISRESRPHTAVAAASPRAVSRPATAPTSRRTEAPALHWVGRVVSRELLTPVADGRVAICDRSLQPLGNEVRSDGDGGFDVGVAEPRSVAELWLVVVHPTYRAYGSLLPTVPVLTGGVLDVRLESPLEVGGSVTLLDGSPVAGAKVRLRHKDWVEVPVPSQPYPKQIGGAPGPVERLAHTDSEGRFKIIGVRPGFHNLDVTARGLLRQHARNGVLDMSTALAVPPSKSGIHIFLEPCLYVACRPVDSKTGKAIRVARQTSGPVHVHDSRADLADMVGLEKEAELKADGTFVGVVTVSQRGEAINLGFEAPGYRDTVFRASVSTLPDASEWPVTLEVADVPMKSDPFRKATTVTVELTGPPWVREFRTLELLFNQRKSASNPAPSSTIFDKRVPMKHGEGTLELLPGTYGVYPAPGFSGVNPILSFEVHSGSENRLRLSAEDGRVPLRIHGLSLMNARTPLVFVAVRDAGQADSALEIMRAKPEWDDPFSVLLLAPPNRSLRLEAFGTGPCGRGTMHVPAMEPGQSFQDLDVTLDWSLP